MEQLSKGGSVVELKVVAGSLRVNEVFLYKLFFLHPQKVCLECSFVECIS